MGVGVIVTETPDEIWKGDLLGRSAEAQLLVGYIESLLDRPGLNRQASAYTIAVDGGYGEGKTYFLSRLARQLKLNHPVAFIDAWADDLADQPMVALMATLKSALGPVLNEPGIQAGWSKLAEKGGKVAKIVAIGAAKRGLGLLISHAGVEALSEVLADAGEPLQEDLRDALSVASNEAIDQIVAGIKLSGDMDRQVQGFHEAQIAMREMKESLRQLVVGLDKSELSPPIVIIVDELDRCRPSYAIKLLEEIKHLFDVPGLVFVFGLHGDQLAHSVRGAYGPTFDGKEYLRRFINRRYSLAKVDRHDLVESLLKECGLKQGDFLFPAYYKSEDTGSRSERVSLDFMVTYYASTFNLSARDLFELTDMLETASTVAKPYPLILPYLLPLLIGHMKGLPPGESPAFPDGLGLRFISGRDSDEFGAFNLFDRMKRLARMTNSQLSQAYNASEGYSEAVIFEAASNQHLGDNVYASPRNYPRLISAVSRFTKE